MLLNMSRTHNPATEELCHGPKNTHRIRRILFWCLRGTAEWQIEGGVVVIQEIFGVNHHIRSVEAGYAKEGYVAIAPQIFDRVERNNNLYLLATGSAGFYLELEHAL